MSDLQPYAGIMGTAASGLSAYGQLAAGGARANVYRANARVAEGEAQTALDQSYYRAGLVAQKTRKTVGAAKASYGASGVVANTGSALHVLNDIAVQGELARQMELYQGRVAATGYNNQARFSRYYADAAENAAWGQAGATLLGSATQSWLNGFDEGGT